MQPQDPEHQHMLQANSATGTPTKPLDWESFLIPATHGTPAKQPQPDLEGGIPGMHRFPAIHTARSPDHLPEKLDAAEASALQQTLKLQLSGGEHAPAAGLDSPPRIRYPHVDSTHHQHREAAHFHAAPSSIPAGMHEGGSQQPQAATSSQQTQHQPPAESEGEFPSMGLPPSRNSFGLMPMRDKLARHGHAARTASMSPQNPAAAGAADPRGAGLGGGGAKIQGHGMMGTLESRPSAPMFPEVDGASTLDAPLPGSPVMEIKSLVKFPAIANGIPSAPPLAAQSFPEPYPTLPPSYGEHSAQGGDHADRQSPASDFRSGSPRLQNPQQLLFPRPDFPIMPLDVPTHSSSNPAVDAPFAADSYSQRGSPYNDAAAEQAQRMARHGSVGSEASNAFSYSSPHASPTRSPYPKVQPPSLYGGFRGPMQGQSGAQLPSMQGNLQGHGDAPTSRQLMSQPSRARDALVGFERAATFRSAVTDSDAHPPALASPTASQQYMPQTLQRGFTGPQAMPQQQPTPFPLNPLPTSFTHNRPGPYASAIPSALHAPASGLPMPASQPNAAPGVFVEGGAAIGGADASGTGLVRPYAASISPAGMAGGAQQTWGPSSPPRSPTGPGLSGASSPGGKRSIWDQLLEKVGPVRQRSPSPSRAQSPSRQGAAAILPIQSPMGPAAEIPMQGPLTAMRDRTPSPQRYQPLLAASSVDASRPVNSPPQPSMQPDGAAPALRATWQASQNAYSHSNSWGRPPAIAGALSAAAPGTQPWSPQYPAVADSSYSPVSMGPSQAPPQIWAQQAGVAPPAQPSLTAYPITMQPQAQSVPTMPLSVIAQNPGISQIPSMRFQSPIRQHVQARPVVPSMVRSASRAGRWGPASGAASTWESLQDQAGPLGAAKLASAAPPGLEPVLRPSSSIAGSIAAQGFSQLEVCNAYTMHACPPFSCFVDKRRGGGGGGVWRG